MGGSGGDGTSAGQQVARRRRSLALLALGAIGAVAALAACRPVDPGDCTTDWTASAPGDWADPANWSSGVVPGPADVACAPPGSSITSSGDVVVASVALDGTLTITDGSLTFGRNDVIARFATLDLSGGRVVGTNFILASSLTWTGGTIEGASSMEVRSATISGGAHMAGSRQLSVTGPTTISGDIVLCDTASIVVLSSVALTDALITGAGCANGAGRFDILGPIGSSSMDGTVAIEVPVDSSGVMTVAPDATASLASLTQSGGSTSIGSAATLTVATPLALDAGRLEGSGTIVADVVGAGTIAPSGLDRLTIDGDYLAMTGAGLELDVAGPSAAGSHDQLVVNGTADLTSTALEVGVASPDAPELGSQFDLVTAHSVVAPSGSAALPPSSFLVVDATSVAVAFATCDPNTFRPGADLAFADLSGVDLHACDLTGADLTDADLTGAILDGANLNGATLNGTDLRGASAIGATFIGASFDHARIDDTDFTNADLTDASITETWPFPGGNPDGAYAATWDNTTCPNGTNSNTLPNGCQGTFVVVPAAPGAILPKDEDDADPLG